jgi:putative hemolysin
MYSSHIPEMGSGRLPCGYASPQARRAGGASQLCQNDAMIFELGIVLALILVNGFFAGAEIALVALRKTRLQELIERGSRAAVAALALREQPERFLATVQVGVTVVSATAATVGGDIFADRLTVWLAGIPPLAEHAHTAALAVVVAVVSYLSIIIGELVPKSIALREAERFALVVARPLLWLSYLARPLVWFLTASSNLLLRPFGDRTTFTEARYSAEEIQQLVEDATKSGSLHPETAELASRAIEFPELTAAEVMVPRRKVIMLPRNAPPEEIVRVVTGYPHTRLPIHDGDPDNVVGYVNIKDLAVRSWSEQPLTIDAVMRKPFFIAEPQSAVDVLREMQQKRIALAIVVDEQGGVAGIVTIEDLVEELVGDLFSEHTRDVPKPITMEPGGTFLASGAVPIREINRALEIELPEDGDWNTIAGLFLALSGHIPENGERVTVPIGVVLEVVDASSHRIRSVRIHLPERAAETAPLARAGGS